MAQDLKIVIGGVEYEIQGDDLASEATLKDLLQATKAKASREKVNRDAEIQATNKHTAALKEANEELDAYTATLLRSQNESKSLFSGLGSAFGKVTSIIPGFGTIFGAAIGTLVSGISMAAGQMVVMTDTLKMVYSSGVRVTGGFSDLALQAGRAGMGFEEFGQYLAKNQTALSRFGGGSVQEGSKRVSEMAKRLTFTTANLATLGLGVAEVSQYLLDYADIQAAITQQDALSMTRDAENNRKFEDRAGNYIKELDKLARITGKTREQMNEQIKAVALDPDLQSTMAALGLSGEKRENITKFAATLSTLPGGETIKSALAGILQYGTAVGESGAALTTVAPRFGAALYGITQGLNDGSLDSVSAADQYNTALTENAEEISRALGNIPAERRTQAEKELFMAAQDAIARRKAVEDEIQAIMYSTGKTKEQAEQQIKDTMKLRQEFETARIGLKSVFNALILKVFGNPTMIKVVEFLTRKLNEFSEMLLKNLEGKNTIGEMFGAIKDTVVKFWEQLWPMIKPVFNSLSDAISDFFDEALEKIFLEIEVRIADLIPGGKKGVDVRREKKEERQIKDRLDKLDQAQLASREQTLVYEIQNVPMARVDREKKERELELLREIQEKKIELANRDARDAIDQANANAAEAESQKVWDSKNKPAPETATESEPAKTPAATPVAAAQAAAPTVTLLNPLTVAPTAVPTPAAPPIASTADFSKDLSTGAMAKSNAPAAAASLVQSDPNAVLRESTRDGITMDMLSRLTGIEEIMYDLKINGIKTRPA